MSGSRCATLAFALSALVPTLCMAGSPPPDTLDTLPCAPLWPLPAAGSRCSGAPRVLSADLELRAAADSVSGTLTLALQRYARMIQLPAPRGGGGGGGAGAGAAPPPVQTVTVHVSDMDSALAKNTSYAYTIDLGSTATDVVIRGATVQSIAPTRVARPCPDIAFVATHTRTHTHTHTHTHALSLAHARSLSLTRARAHGVWLASCSG